MKCKNEIYKGFTIEENSFTFEGLNFCFYNAKIDNRVRYSSSIENCKLLIDIITEAYENY